MPEPNAWDTGFQDEEVDFGSVFRDEEEVTSPEYPPEGLYHVTVQSVDSSGEKFPGAVFMVFEILSGNVEGQAGKSLRWVVWAPKADAKNPAASKKRWQKDVLQLMLALGLREPGEFPKVVFNTAWWASLEGRQCIVRVVHVEKTTTSESGRKSAWVSAEISRRDDFFAIGSEAVAGVVIDKEAATLGGYIGEEGDI